MSMKIPDKFYPNRTIVPSRSIYDLAQLRIAAARLAKAHRNRTIENTTMNSTQSKSHYRNEIFMEHLKIIITISVSVILLMTIIVITCIIVRYYQNKYPTITERKPEEKRRNTQYTRVVPDKRKFSRKQRTLPTSI